MRQAIRVQGRHNLPFFLPADGITGYQGTGDDDFLAVKLTRGIEPLIVMAAMAELDRLIAAILVCPIPAGHPSLGSAP